MYNKLGLSATKNQYAVQFKWYLNAVLMTRRIALRHHAKYGIFRIDED